MPVWGPSPTTGGFVATTATDLTNALSNIGANGGTILIPTNTTITTGSSITIPDYTTIRGADRSSRIVYSGTGTLATLTNKTQVRFENLRISASGASGTLFNLNNSFRCVWRGCTIDGSYASGSSNFQGQVGWNLNGNAGDNRIIDCEINNLGEAIITSTQINYLVNSVIGTCWRGVHGGDGAGVNFAAGMAITNCTFHGDAGATNGVEHHIYIDGTANTWWITDCWFEKCDKAIEVGAAGVGGPAGFFLRGCKVASKTSTLIITAARQTSLRDIIFGQDTGATPTDLTITAATAADGIAENLIALGGTEIDTSVVPAGWTFFPRAVATGARVTGNRVTFNGVFIQSGAGTPEGVVTAGVGALFLRTDGGATTTLYVKTSGSGNTGWTAK